MADYSTDPDYVLATVPAGQTAYIRGQAYVAGGDPLYVHWLDAKRLAHTGQVQLDATALATIAARDGAPN